MENLIKKIEDVPTDKKLIVFDLDGTLTESKSVMDKEMAELLKELIRVKKIAVIGGGKYEQFQRQLLEQFNVSGELLKNLFLFPTSAAQFYRYNKGWREVYAEELSSAKVDKIKKAFKDVVDELNYKNPEKTYGPIVEDRRAQVTFSFLGQDVVKVLGDEGVELKKKWRDENGELKLKIAEAMQRKLPDLEVRAAGYTSIDVTKKGLDKEYGIHQIEKNLGVLAEDMIFIGDALFPGGNDHAVLRTDVLCFEVKTVDVTKKLVKHLLS